MIGGGGKGFVQKWIKSIYSTFNTSLSNKRYSCSWASCMTSMYTQTQKSSKHAWRLSWDIIKLQTLMWVYFGPNASVLRAKEANLKCLEYGAGIRHLRLQGVRENWDSWISSITFQQNRALWHVNPPPPPKPGVVRTFIYTEYNYERVNT